MIGNIYAGPDAGELMNGAYMGPTQATASETIQPVGAAPLRTLQADSAVLIAWLILFGVLVLANVLTLRFQA